MLKVGVLALQGAFAKHIKMLRSLGAEAIDVRKPQDLASCDALVIPGGESTTMMRQIQFIEMQQELKRFGKEKPVFGTCAGLILISQEILADVMEPFGLIEVAVERNAFGRQAESFTADLNLNISSKSPHPFKAVFIRAPRIRRCSPHVKVLAQYEEEPVLVQQDKYLGATFHPELTNDPYIHDYFLKIVKNHKKS